MDRRKPLGGVEKETYVNTGGNPLTFDLIVGMKSDLCHEIKLIQKDTDAIKSQCSCRMGQCELKFIKRVHPKIPLSIAEFTAYLVIAGILVGLGYKILNLPLPMF